MEQDGYQLYEQLKDGAETTLRHQGHTYKLRLKGKPASRYNYLAVNRQHGQEKWFGRGRGSG